MFRLVNLRLQPPSAFRAFILQSRFYFCFFFLFLFWLAQSLKKKIYLRLFPVIRFWTDDNGNFSSSGHQRKFTEPRKQQRWSRAGSDISEWQRGSRARFHRQRHFLLQKRKTYNDGPGVWANRLFLSIRPVQANAVLPEAFDVRSRSLRSSISIHRSKSLPQHWSRQLRVLFTFGKQKSEAKK